MLSLMKPLPEHVTDDFDRLPEPIILTIFNFISDIKTLIRCRTVSRRFNYLVPHSSSLLLRVDQVISSSDTNTDNNTSPVITFIKSIFKSFQDWKDFLLLNNNNNNQSFNNNGHGHTQYYSPAMILRGFERVREIDIELPTGDLRLTKRVGIKWRAEFGKSLKSCVILGYRRGGVSESELGGGGGLKTRVVWTISALIAASARHYMVKDIVDEHSCLSKLVVKDREGEGNEFREEEDRVEIRDDDGDGDGVNGGSVWWRSNRTRVPAVWMRMRHEAKLELSNGVTMEGATLVVVRPTSNGSDEVRWDEGLVAAGRGFDGVYGEAVAKLINRRMYVLEMNSF